MPKVTKKRIINDFIKDGTVSFCILTYDNAHLPTDTAAANIAMRNYAKRLKNAARRQGIQDFKYFAVTKNSERNRRLYHCVVTNYPDIAGRVWLNGLVSEKHINVSSEAYEMAKPFLNLQ